MVVVLLRRKCDNRRRCFSLSSATTSSATARILPLGISPSLPPSLSLSLFPLSRFPAYFGAIVPAIKVSDIVQCLVLLFYLIYF